MKNPQHTLLSLLFIPFCCWHLSAQTPDLGIRIENPDADTLFYCGIPVAVAPGIIIENLDIEKPSDGIKISIVNYVSGEDKLVYTGDEFTATWYPQVGNLEITGMGTAADLQEAVRNVYYENISGDPATEFRSISISLLDADYLPESGHFYRYVPQPDITWHEARDAAEGMSYHELQGYLATITSAVENEFIWSKIDGLGWIGATDEETEGTWKWVTGPEGLDGGMIFWDGDASGQPVDGNYANWSEGEPNNLYGEHYAHINLDPNKEDKTWNDLPNAGGGGIYRSQGYIVEFGGMPGDPPLQLSASAVIGVNQVPEVIIQDFDSLVCGERQLQLQIQIDQEIATILRPLDENSFVRDSTSLSPTVEVQEFGRYRFELEIYNEHQCSWFDTVFISFQHQPVALLNLNEAQCIDSDLRLFFTGEVSGEALYEWYANNILYDSGVNMDTVEVALSNIASRQTVGLKIMENGCVDSVYIPVTVKPAVEILTDKTEGCTPLDVRFNVEAADDIDQFFWSFANEGNATTSDPVYTFVNPDPTDRSFDVSLRIVSAEGCESSDTLRNLIQVHPAPTVDIGFDESVCYDGTEEIWYSGNAGLRDTFLWDLSAIQPHEIIQHPGNHSGPLQFNLSGKPTAEIGLQVITEFGCKTDTLYKTYKRNPVISVTPDTLGGCPPFAAELTVSAADFVDQVEYTWDLGNGQAAQGNTVSAVYSQQNRYFDITVNGVSTLTGCTGSLFLPGKIFVFPVPAASFDVSASSVLVSDPEIRFANTSSGAILYQWDFGDNSMGSFEENPVHRYENPGWFDVSLLAVNQYECLDSAFTRIAVNFDKIYPPTAFSPNATNELDREFRVYAEGVVNEGYKLLIFNRWGEVIFTSHSPELGWDGKMKNGSNAPAGAYFWVLEYRDLLGIQHSQNGSLTLLF